MGSPGSGQNGDASCTSFQELANDFYRVDDVELPIVKAKKAFIVGALEKEIRLSFAQRIRGTLPEPYQALIGEAKEKDTPDFKYDTDRK